MGNDRQSVRNTRRATPEEQAAHEERCANRVLSGALRQADWSPRELTRALNPRLEAVGQRALHLTAPQGWLRGGRPRSAIVRRLTATVLSEATGTQYTAAELWGDPLPTPRDDTVSTDDLLGRRPLDDVLATAAAWTTSDPGQQATLRPASEEQLFSAVWDATRQRPPHLRPGHGEEQVLPPLMDVLEGHLRDLRRLDDTAGGGTLSQRYVRTELIGLLDLLRNSRYTPDIGDRLLSLAAGTAQLAGWMSFDADLTAAAQRYQLLAIRLARAADDTSSVANILGMLAYQHAASGMPTAALRYAEAAVDHASRNPPIVRARALGRLATAHAASGNIDAFRAAADQSRTLLQHRGDDDPPALYYFTPDQVAAESGHALVELAAANPAYARRLLAEAVELLSPLTHHGPSSGFKRSALLHGIHLARAHLLARDTEAVAASLHHLADNVPDVQSLRCRNLLRRLRRTVGTHSHSLVATDALSTVDRALSTS